MRRNIAAALFGMSLIVTSADASTEMSSCNFFRQGHQYASAAIIDASAEKKEEQLVGNAFAIYARPLRLCPVEDSVCEDSDLSTWRVLFATAAHVVRDACRLVAQNHSLSLWVFKDRESVSKNQESNGGLVTINLTKQWCKKNQEAANFVNAAYAGAARADREFNGVTLRPDDYRKTSDQYFFVQDLSIGQRDYVMPFLVAPLPKSRKKTDFDHLVQIEGVRFAGLEEDKIGEGLYWTSPDPKGDQIANINLFDRVGFYWIRNVLTQKGQSGSPILEVHQEGKTTKVRVIGILTNAVLANCAETVGNVKLLPEQLASEDVTLAKIQRVDEQMQIRELCETDPAVLSQNKDKTEFVPVMRFPRDLLEKFDSAASSTSASRNGGSAAAAQFEWFSSPGMVRPLRRLIEYYSLEDKDERKRDELRDIINELLDQMPPYEATFAFARIAKIGNINSGILDRTGCERLEPSFEKDKQ